MSDYLTNIQKFKEALNSADAILIGAGAGFSTASGLEYGGQRYMDNFKEYHEKYGLTDMYSTAFYPFPTLEEKWAFFSKHIYINRYLDTHDTPYKDLLELIRDKNYFVLTTNADHKFVKNGFDKSRLFYMQGDYGLFQCSVPCQNITYDNKEQILQMVKEQKDMKIPTNLIPYCPNCGEPMDTNLRKDNTFVQDEGWEKANQRYMDFVNENKNKKILFIELGVGYNTPSIIKYPFWQMTHNNPDALFCCMNFDDVDVPDEIRAKTIAFKGDIKKILEDLKK